MREEGPSEGQVAFFPIRHHSPACAAALLAGLEALRPRQVLVEGPVDFEPLIGDLVDIRTRPPVAIVSLPGVRASGDRYVATYPFCAHSPEYVALTWAARNRARAAFIDLPARHPDMRRDGREGEPQAAPLIAEWRLDHNAYVAELCARRGVADPLALWDALFESRLGAADWRGFFASVGLYCRHIRETTAAEDMAVDGTLAREAHMADRIRQARLDGPGPVAVIAGGFHVSALYKAVMAPGVPGAPAKAPPPNAFLIRYGFRQLDRAAGYGAGLPHPKWYDRAWRAHADGEGAAGLAAEVLGEFAHAARKAEVPIAFPTPALAAAMLAAERLSDLRGLPAPGRTEVIDAVRSTGVKEAIEAGHAPVLDALDAFLTGDALGELSPGAAQPPIVEAVRAQARALGFSIDDGVRRNRDLDILRKPRHAAASRFLFALDLAGAGFASRIAGPDPVTGWRGDALFETWSYAWSPHVEAELIARSADGQTLEALCLAELDRRRARLLDEGRSRSAGAAAQLLAAAVRTGIERAVAAVAAWCAEACAADADPASIIAALHIADNLSRPGPGAPDWAARLAPLKRAAFERLLQLFPDLAHTPEDQMPSLVRALSDLAALASSSEDDLSWDRLGEAVRSLLDRSAPPALQGALVAFASLIGVLDDRAAAGRIAALLDGAYYQPGQAAAALTGCLAVAPRLIVHVPALTAAADRFVTGVDQEHFVAALPELRLAFGQLTPSEIDRLAGWVAERHGLEASRLLDEAAPAEEIARNLAMTARLTAVWTEEGLGQWLGISG